MATITELPSDEPMQSTFQQEDPIPAGNDSHENTEGAVEKCLEVLRKAKTDTEVFAALLLVSMKLEYRNYSNKAPSLINAP